MEVTGKIKKIDETKTVGASGFKIREMVVTTNEQYPQMILIQFVQDKCDLLNNFKVDQEVKVSVNLRGREWINPQGEAVYFNTIQGWRIEAEQAAGSPSTPPAGNFETTAAVSDDSEPDDLPF
ncbi:DUF3127 domain-containing protein [Lutibacter sp. HS1-25]|uniref:DUF3127 domain-containing protein n=1 Tax=Lutibacter sp. HS1-25 TaxID=2485000 RepID=UPI0010126AD2|nr:DUF3127 domain-containing protein [Lutibacter sp. HS1-25]RXP55520.1 DUF3127 domain-containing protein [Lutibacter sp. HS1-25]